MIDRYGVEVSGQLLWADGLFPFALDQPQPLVGRCPRFLILPLVIFASVVGSRSTFETAHIESFVAAAPARGFELLSMVENHR